MDLKPTILAPLTVNLLTAFILFTTVLVFKEPIFRAFHLYDADFPLYCIPELFHDPGWTKGMSVELFIINETGQLWKVDQLGQHLSGKAGGIRPWDPDIRLLPKSRGLNPIVDVTPDQAFNTGKGRLTISGPEPDAPHWKVRINEIQPNAILKVRVRIQSPRKTRTRQSKTAVPFRIDYPGKPVAGS